jgi:hypothetical protein
MIGIAAVTVLGCDAVNRKITSADESEVGPYPAQYKIIIRDYLRKTLLDPYTVRDAQISRPQMGKLFIEGTLGVHESGWLVCFRSNAKNRMGAYTGISDTALLIRGDRVLASSSDPSHTNYPIKQICDDEKYEAFPEMTQLIGISGAR